MKLVVFFILGLFVFNACERLEEKVELTDSQTASEIALDYLELEENQYLLNLTESEAAELGISQYDYDRMVQEIAFTNQQIREWEKMELGVCAWNSGY